ncbi:MAG: excinuclease ATPase subunit [Parvibaculum sp.]|nr:excinuclease ATPase subunit [Parvibaculum sp.]
MATMSKFSTFSKAVLLGAAFVLGAVQVTEARNGMDIFPVEPVLKMTGKDGERLDGTVAFYFGNTPHPPVLEHLGNYTTNKKTNSVNKSDVEACNWVLLSALLSLQQRAKNEGGNAVINIKSYYKKDEQSYDNEFECHAGAFVAGVALKGDVVKLKK